MTCLYQLVIATRVSLVGRQRHGRTHASKDVKSALRDFPDQVSQVEYFDLGQLMEMFKPMIDEMMQDEVEDLDLKSDDLPDFPYFMLGWASYVKRGLISKVTLFPRSSK